MALIAGSIVAGGARAQERLPPVAPETYTPDQMSAAQAFVAARGRAPFGPFSVLMRSPAVMVAAREMGDYLRYKATLGQSLTEFTILINAGLWRQDYEWSVHAPMALKAGISPAVIQALGEGRAPRGMSTDEALCWRFTRELTHDRKVGDKTYRAALKRFGEAGVVDLTAISGYYTMLAMVLNVAQTPPEAGAPTLPKQRR